MNRKPSNNPPSSSQSHSYPQSTPAPAVQTPSATQSAGLQYTKPSVGTNNVLTLPEIRWCTREGIRIEAMRDVIDTDAGIDEFNRIVSDYNSRCGSYQYSQGSQKRAERDLEAYLSQIVSEAIRDASQLEGKNQSSLPSVSLGASTSSSPKKPSAQYTRAAQQLLSDLGYDPGPVDGLYGRRTGDAVKAFQRDMKLKQDGWVDQDLLSALRMIIKEKKSIVAPKKEEFVVADQPTEKPIIKQKLPNSGDIHTYTTAIREAPFEIKAAQGNHYLVKLVNAHTFAPVLTVFVQSGTTVSVDVPLGSYEVRYASGEFWYGYEYLFGPETMYSKAKKTFTFEIVGNQISGYTITLYKVPHGNLPISTIKPTEF